MPIVYTPNGTSGYRCEFTGAGELAVTVCWEADVAETGVAPEGLPTRALVGAVERHAEHEFARRRTRNEQKALHHMNEAKRWLGVAEQVGALLSELTDKVEDGWCSDCLTKTSHRLSASRTRFGTRRYVCVECGSPTGWCDVPRCRHFADRGGDAKRSSRFCAEHGQEIPSFEKLNTHVGSLDDYLPWLEHEKFNARKFTTIAVASIAGIAVVGPLARTFR
jgi:hypothetical protein